MAQEDTITPMPSSKCTQVPLGFAMKTTALILFPYLALKYLYSGFSETLLDRSLFFMCDVYFCLNHNFEMCAILNVKTTWSIKSFYQILLGFHKRQCITTHFEGQDTFLSIDVIIISLVIDGLYVASHILYVIETNIMNNDINE